MRWDIVKDLRPGGQVLLDGEVVQQDGAWKIWASCPASRFSGHRPDGDDARSKEDDGEGERGLDSPAPLPCRIRRMPIPPTISEASRSSPPKSATMKPIPIQFGISRSGRSSQPSLEKIHWAPIRMMIQPGSVIASNEK